MRWIIGDVHGMLRPLETVLDEVYKQDRHAVLLFVGDYVNRGPDSRAVLDLLLTLKDARFVRGNHDDIFDQVVNNQSYADNASGGNRLAAFQWFMSYGLDSTFLSYGADVAYLRELIERPTPQGLAALAYWVPEAHRRFIRTLPPYIEFDDILVAHGKWGVEQPDHSSVLAGQLDQDQRLRHQLLWGRYTEEEILHPKKWKRTAYFGHTVVANYRRARARSAQIWGRHSHPGLMPVAGPKIVLLDTGAALSADGRLTAMCADTKTIVQADHFGELIHRSPTRKKDTTP